MEHMCIEIDVFKYLFIMKIFDNKKEMVQEVVDSRKINNTKDTLL